MRPQREARSSMGLARSIHSFIPILALDAARASEPALKATYSVSSTGRLPSSTDINALVTADVQRSVR